MPGELNERNDEFGGTLLDRWHTKAAIRMDGTWVKMKMSAP